VGRDQQGPAIAPIEHRVVDHVAEEVRPLEIEASPRGVAAEHLDAFAGYDEQSERSGCVLGHGGLPGNDGSVAR